MALVLFTVKEINSTPVALNSNSAKEVTINKLENTISYEIKRALFLSTMFTGLFTAHCLYANYREQRLSQIDYSFMVFGQWMGYFLYCAWANHEKKISNIQNHTSNDEMIDKGCNHTSQIAL